MFNGSMTDTLKKGAVSEAGAVPNEIAAVASLRKAVRKLGIKLRNLKQDLQVRSFNLSILLVLIVISRTRWMNWYRMMTLILRTGIIDLRVFK